MKSKLLLLHFLLPLFVFSQTQIGEDIDGEAAIDHSGQSVSLSADGSIVAIGAPVNDGNGNASGHVRVYQNTGGTWAQIGEDIDGEAPGDDSGSAVSLSDDGSIVAIGARLHDVQNPWSGHVRIFQYIGGTWTQLGQDIEAENADDNCGMSVSLNGDGNIVAIGSPRNDGNGSNSGHVRIFQYTGGSWTQIGADIDGEYAGDRSGDPNRVSLNNSGNIVAIGSSNNFGGGTDAGHVRIFQYTGGSWTQIGADIDGEAENDFLGTSVNLSNDGNILAIGAAEYDPFGGTFGNGYVQVYQNTGGAWTQIGDDIVGEAYGDRFGLSLSLSSDGSIVAIGAPVNDGNGNASGHVRVYQNTGGTWAQIGEDIDGEAPGDDSGSAVSLSDDGSVVAIGAYLNDGINGVESGHVRVFDLSTVMGIDDNSLHKFSVFPSPTSDILNIESETTITQIEIHNLFGQLVKSNKNQNTIDISSVSQGVYFIKVKDENGNFGAQKVVKE